VLRKIFGPTRDEITGEWRKLHEKNNDLNCSPNIVRVIKSREMRWKEHVACIGDRKGAYGVLVEKPEGKIPVGGRGRRGGYNIKMCVQEVGWKVSSRLI
jgi:hypothetical protein